MMRGARCAGLAVSLGVSLLGSCTDEARDAGPGPVGYVVPAPERESSGAALLPVPAARGPRGFAFTEVSNEAGLDFVHENGAFGAVWLPETMGAGGTFLDYDADGWVDILLVNSDYWPGHDEGRPHPTPRLYRNQRDGTFADVTAAAGLDFSLYGMGAAAADYDADGDVDVFITAYQGGRLLRNDDGRFVDITRAAGVAADPNPDGTPPWSVPALWFDADRDGWLDLFVCSYVKWTPELDVYSTIDGVTKSFAVPDQYNSDSCRYLRGLGDGRFEDRTAWAGLLDSTGKSLGVVMEDVNDDGWPDLMVANDRIRNFLYLNQGNGSFIDQGVAAGVAYDDRGLTRSGMGIDIARLGDQGTPTIAIGNFSEEPVSLFARIGPDLYMDRSGPSGLAGPTLPVLTFGLVFADFDLDGYQDLMLANGHLDASISVVVPEITFREPAQLFLGDGKGRFEDVSAAIGADFEEPLVARGLATADYDRDGDLDVLVTTNGGPVRLFRNDRPADPPSVRVRLVGASPNREAIGAVVTLFAGGRAQRRMIRTGGSYLSQSETNPILFGLGDASGADSVVVRWPTSGTEDRFGPLPAGQTLVAREVRDG